MDNDGMTKNKRTQWTHETEITWGSHEGTKLKDIPASYFKWLSDQPWVKDWPQLQAYIKQNEDKINQATTEDNEDDEKQGYTSYQDFLDDR